MPVKMILTLVARKEIISKLITMTVTVVGERLLKKALDKYENRKRSNK